MHVIALISQKGGSGKTTLATALAVAHQQDGGRAAVADLDPQGSSVAWHHFRDGEPPLVAAVHPPRLDRSLRTFRSRGVSLVLIDTAPHASAGSIPKHRPHLDTTPGAHRRPDLVEASAWRFRPNPEDLESARSLRAMLIKRAAWNNGRV